MGQGCESIETATEVVKIIMKEFGSFVDLFLAETEVTYGSRLMIHD